MKESLPLRVLIHVLDRVYFQLKAIYIYIESHGVDSQLSNEEPFHEKRGSVFFFEIKSNTARVCQIHAATSETTTSLGPWHCQRQPRKALNSRERGAWWVLVAGSHRFFVSSWHRGLKMDGWKTTLSFWVSAYFSGAKC